MPLEVFLMNMCVVVLVLLIKREIKLKKSPTLPDFLEIQGQNRVFYNVISKIAKKLAFKSPVNFLYAISSAQNLTVSYRRYSIDSK